MKPCVILHDYTLQDYKAVFEQLVLEECGALVLRGVEEGEVLEPHPSVVIKRHKVGVPPRGRTGRGDGGEVRGEECAAGGGAFQEDSHLLGTAWGL